MLELVVVLTFVGVLIGCLILDVSIVYALAAGYFIFFFYGWKKGYQAKAVFRMSLDGVRTVKNIVLTFVLIGMLTALWRAAGTIPVIICYAAKLIHPSIFVLLTFLLNALLSLLMGTSFGTAATMGVICMTMGRTMGVNPAYVGGAIVSGIYFGDRCSPVSTSALLVSEVTGTDLYENIKGMMKTATIPFLLSCGIYLLLGLSQNGVGELLDMEALFGQGFTLHWILVVPALLVLVLAAFRIPVKKALMASIVMAAILGVVVQHIQPLELIKLMLFGFKTEIPELAAMMNGGGITSMISTSIIVALSSSFSGIFEQTGLLDGMKTNIAKIAEKATAFGATALVSVVACMLFCNQTLSTILTNQLCKDVEPDKQERAMNLENTVIVIAALIPWSIAFAVPAATTGAPVSSLFSACYLYLLPLWNWGVHIWKRR